MLGCAPEREPELGSFVARGEHVEVWASDGIEVCGGNVEHMDRFVEAFRDFVGPRPEAEFHRYYVLDGDDWEELDRCRDGATGCVVRHRTVYARMIPSTHELVHAELGAGGHTLLEEGIAEVFGNVDPDRMPLGYEILDALEHGNNDLPFEAYQRAAHFTRFLLDQHGIDAFLKLRDATSLGDDADRLDEAFDEALGISLDEALADYAEFPELCFNAGYRPPMVECAAPSSPWQDATTFTETVDLSCGSPDVLGPFGGEIFTLRAFEVAKLDEFSIEIDAEGTDEARAWVVKCDSECARLPREDREYPFEPAQTVIEARVGQPREALLYPGKYWLRLARPADAPGPITLRITARGA